MNPHVPTLTALAGPAFRIRDERPGDAGARERLLDAAGRPERVEDLSSHRLISQNPATPQVAAGAALVHSLVANDIRSTLSVNNYYGVLQGVLYNLGIGVLPDYLADDFPTLERVLPDVESSEVPVYLAYPEELRHSKRVAAFRDFVMEEIIADRKRRVDEAGT